MLEPGKAAKTDKTSTIADAIRIVTQLRAENGQLRQLNKFLEVRRVRTACSLLLLATKCYSRSDNACLLNVRKRVGVVCFVKQIGHQVTCWCAGSDGGGLGTCRSARRTWRS